MIDMGKRLTPEQKHLYKRIDEILWDHWDPIGVNTYPEARDEYYPYLPEVYLLAQKKASEREIAEYLSHVEKDIIGVSGNFENCLRIAGMVLNIRPGDGNGY